MIRKRYLVLFALALALFWLLPAQAQNPDDGRSAPGAMLALAGETITYQGLLRESGGLANGIYDFQFTLYDALTGGTALGVVGQNDIAVNAGLFTVQLTFGEGLFNGEGRWLELAVKADAGATYTTLTPRQPVTAAPLALALPGFWTRQNATSPNLLGGYEGNTITASAVGITINGGGTSGNLNSAYDNYSSIGGGSGNSVGSNDGSTTNDIYSTISGGQDNSINQEYGVIGGGQTNTIGAAWATVGGGRNNINNGRYGVIAGGGGGAGLGGGNIIYDDHGTIGGGSDNVAGVTGDTTSQTYVTIGGGRGNTAGEDYATIGGGRSNVASDVYATIGGGYNNSVSAQFGAVGGGGSTTAGQGNRVYDNYGTIGGGTNNVVGITGDANGQPYATVAGGNGNTASEDAATVGGGQSNTASANYSTVSGGQSNTANANNATVGGGQGNTANANNATVGGGQNNLASFNFATVGGGQSNQATNRGAFVGGGITNTATGDLSTVVAGVFNDATAVYATVVGGINNNATGGGTFIGGGQDNNANGALSAILGGAGNTTFGEYAVAAGQGAVAKHDGTFVWAGKQEKAGDTIESTAPGQFIVRAPGGAWFGGGTKALIPDGAVIATESGAFLSKGGTWANSSDRALKSNFAAINGRALLDQLAAIPILSWNYTSEGEAVRHIGPTAQDFYAAFGLGSDDRHIATVDADGVALAAIQGLNSLVGEQADLIDRQASQIAGLDARLAALERGEAATAMAPWALIIAGLAIGLGLGWGLGRRNQKGGAA